MRELTDSAALRIILADDDEDDRELFSEAIKTLKIQYDFQSVEDGSKLMKYLLSCELQCPNMIFLDLNMPRKNGSECLTEIRANEKFKNTVVIIYSTSSEQSDIEASYSAGANSYIIKPSNMEKLKTIITQIVSIDWQHTFRLSRENFVMA